MKIRITLTLLLLGFLAGATHNRAGEIIYTRLSDLKYRITVITYTSIDGSNADRCSLVVSWGDGSPNDTLSRTNGPPANGCPNGGDIIVPNKTKRNVYTGDHTYPAAGTYIIGMLDPNRNANVVNIPNSVNVPFYIESIIKISPGLGPNSAPVLLNAPIDDGCVGEIFEHNPGAFDPDGDSLSYKLVPSRQGPNQNVSGYSFPSASNSLSIDPITGDLVWDSPLIQGEFNIAIEISEWRNGIVIGRILRDMQVLVAGCNNEPPEIQPIPDLCVTAGDQLKIPIQATDSDGDRIELTVSGGPFVVDSPAFFNQGIQGTGFVRDTMYWDAKCLHVRKAPYLVSVKAQEDRALKSPALVDYYSFFIQVVAPAPENLQAQALGNSIQLNWDASICSEAEGYDIYRRTGFFGFIPDSCETGVPAYTGYQKIAEVDGLGNTSYLDDDSGDGLITGLRYCYMVVARFEDGSESYASQEVCAELPKIKPMISHVDIQETSSNTGEIYLEWIKPTEFDTLIYPGPYAYEVFRGDGFSGGSPDLVYTGSGLNDTSFTDLNLDTEGKVYHYEVVLRDLGLNQEISKSSQASSLRLGVQSAGNRLILSWQSNHPWLNEQYLIYREDLGSGIFNLIDSTQATSFVDAGLENGDSYCYYILAKGRYNAFPQRPLFLNKSQIQCGVPVDTVPPCQPLLSLVSDCENLVNALTWETLYSDECERDVDRYELYFTPSLQDEYSLLATLNSGADSSFIHSPDGSVAGCYYVIAIDSNGNRSIPSETVCTDNCPAFDLPDVFSPNGDGNNDLLIPLNQQFVEEVNCTIFNRWGSIVFQTNNLNIEWDGINQMTGEPCSEGVYYYDIKVYEKRLEGLVIRNLGGYVHLFR